MSEGEAEDDKRLDRDLARREQPAFFIGTIIFFGLLWMGRCTLAKWDAESVALLANAVTVTGSITIPIAVWLGGADLIAWIIRFFRRARRRLDAIPGEIAEPPRTKAGDQTPRASIRSQDAIGCVIPILICVVIFAGVLFAAPPLIRAVSSRVHEPLNAKTIVTKSPYARAQSDRPLSEHCEATNEGAICEASAAVRSPEELGIEVCGIEGLGWSIFNQARREHAYEFGDREIPIGTRFRIVCPDNQP